MHDFQVPFENNLAERDFRMGMAKVHRRWLGVFAVGTGLQSFVALVGGTIDFSLNL
jgi:hypothetical protein